MILLAWEMPKAFSHYLHISRQKEWPDFMHYFYFWYMHWHYKSYLICKPMNPFIMHLFYIVDDNLDLLLIFEAHQTRKRFTQNDDDTGLSCNLIAVCFNFKVFPASYCSYFCISKAEKHFFFFKNMNILIYMIPTAQPGC